MNAVTTWLAAHESWLAWLAILSIVMLVASALLIPWIIARLPADYFARDEAEPLWHTHHPAVRLVLMVLKNLLGVVLVGLGILMLLLPGQGVLTIIAGVAMLDIPGRHRLVQWMASRDPVRRGLNWVRRKAGRQEFATSVAVNARRG